MERFLKINKSFLIKINNDITLHITPIIKQNDYVLLKNDLWLRIQINDNELSFTSMRAIRCLNEDFNVFIKENETIKYIEYNKEIEDVVKKVINDFMTKTSNKYSYFEDRLIEEIKL